MIQDTEVVKTINRPGRCNKSSSRETLQVRLATPCCDYCQISGDKTQQSQQELAKRVEELERAVDYDRALALVELKMEWALKLFDHSVNTEIKHNFFVSDPAALTNVFNAAYQSVRTILEEENLSPHHPAFREFQEAHRRAFTDPDVGSGYGAE